MATAMPPASRARFTSCIFVTAVAFHLVNSLPQETLFTGEINSRNCSAEIHPSVNISSEFHLYTDISYRTKLMMSHTPKLVLTCYELYPVEWVFQQEPPDDAVASILERREWIPSGNDVLIQKFLIEVTLKLTTKIQNITCRAATDGEVCRQTTVKFVRDSINGINTTAATVYQGLPRGELLQQYSNAFEGENINCSLHLIYNEIFERFECYTRKNETKISLQKLEVLSTDLCYDSFSCELLYNRKEIEYCAKKFKQDGHNLGTKLKQSPYRSNNVTGIVTCKLSAEVFKNERNTEELQTVSASSHFFQPPFFDCDETRNQLQSPQLYMNLDSLSMSEIQQFILLCGLKKNSLVLGDIRKVFCLTSVYLFAEGVQMTITMQDGSRSGVKDIALINAQNQSQIKKEGYRSYSTDIKIESRQISKISCSAPLRRNRNWVVKTKIVEVTNPVPLELNGNNSETVLVQRDLPVSLKCLAFGEPSPQYDWINLITNSSFPENWVYLSPFDESSQLTIPVKNVSLLAANSVLCTARNRFDSIHKTFKFKFEDTKSVVKESESYWVAIGIFIIVIVVTVVGGSFAFLVCKIIRQKRELRILSKIEIEEFMNGNPEIFLNSNTECDINSYSSCLPYNKDFEVLKEQLEIDMSKMIGSGAYGIVLKGLLINKSTEKVQVAIKTCKPMDDVSYLKALMSELKIMGYIGKHENIVNLLGACTRNLNKKEIFIAIEYCDNGCLLSYLRSHRENFVDQTTILTETDSDLQPNELTTTMLLRWAIQISNGMDFLYHKKVIHGDLAARNILLSLNLTAKIGDFGLSRQLFEYANYIKKQQSPLPWKWLAIECLQDMQFSSQSDVWAYGITLWEIFTLGHSPFPGCSYNESFIDSLVSGKRPNQPQYSTNECYNLMSKCWDANPSERPSFADISEFFGHTLRTIQNEACMNMNRTSKTNSELPAEGTKRTYINV